MTPPPVEVDVANFFELSLDLLGVGDMEGNLLKLNPQFPKVFGYTMDELLAIPLLELTHPDDREATIRQMAENMSGGDLFNFKNRLRCKDGSYRTLLYAAKPVPEQGLVYFSAKDITELDRSNEALVDSERRYRLLAENAADIVWQLDADENMTWVTPSIESVLGWRPEQLIGTNPIRLVHPDDREVLDPRRLSALAGATVDPFEVRVRTTDGDYRWVSAQVRPTTDADGVVDSVIVGLRDITERRLAEDRLRRQGQEILELSTPVMQIWDGIVVVPLIGALDSARTAQFMERLLDRIVETNSPMALVDITGVPTIDTRTAQNLIEAITAVRLLGAQVVLTGVRPVIAQTLVHLGVDLSGITTRSSMADGLKVALDALSLRVVGHDLVSTKS